MATPQEPRRGRGRPRTPGAEKRIIEAALEEYGELGWSGFTMDGVARRAGVGKSTVYLRWQDKDTLLTDAVGTASDFGDVDTGSLRGDLQQLAVDIFRHFRTPAGWASLRITIDTAGAPEPLGRFSEEVTGPQLVLVEQIVERGVARGEAAATVNAGDIARCLYGSVMLQSLGVRLASSSLSDEEIEERAAALVEIVLDGALR